MIEVGVASGRGAGEWPVSGLPRSSVELVDAWNGPPLSAAAHLVERVRMRILAQPRVGEGGFEPPASCTQIRLP
jgi:hypothetical protein